MISDFEALTRVIEILDDDELFVHGIFLLSKVNVRILNEIHIRLILEKYDIFIKKKLLLLTYTLNPLMVSKKKNIYIFVCVLVCVCEFVLTIY